MLAEYASGVMIQTGLQDVSRLKMLHISGTIFPTCSVSFALPHRKFQDSRARFEVERRYVAAHPELLCWICRFQRRCHPQSTAFSQSYQGIAVDINTRSRRVHTWEHSFDAANNAILGPDLARYLRKVRTAVLGTSLASLSITSVAISPQV